MQIPYERLAALHQCLHLDTPQQFKFNWNALIQTGLSSKDFIAPSSFQFKDGRYFRVGASYGAASFLQIDASRLSHTLLSALLDCDACQIFTIHAKALEHGAALKAVKRKLSDLDKTKIDEQKRATRTGYDYDILPPDLKTYAKEAENLLEALQSHDEKLFNLKEAAKTLTYLTEHGITEYAALEKLAAEQTAKRDAAVTTIRQYEQRMERIADLRTHIVNYAKTRDIYLQYRKLPAAKKAAFASAHEDELMLHRAAKQAFEEYGEKKLPAIKDLQAEYKELLEKKRVAYAEYRPLKQQAQELETIKKNVDSLLQIDAAQQAREAEKSRSEQSQSR